MIDEKGFRHGVGIVIVNDRNRLFWAKRQNFNGWQFPQGGMEEGEAPEQAMYRELYEEVGLNPDDVDVLAETKGWLYYYLPKHLVRYKQTPLCIGQKQKWYLLKLKNTETEFRFDMTGHPEFAGFRWVSYWFPLRQVIFFKRKLYRSALREFAPFVFDHSISESK